MGRAAPTKDGSLKLDGMSKIKEETSPVVRVEFNQ